MSLRFYSSNDLCLQKTEAVFRRCFVEKLLLKISQNSGKNTCERVYFLIKLQAKGDFTTKTLQVFSCFLVNFVKFLRAFFLWNTSGGCFCHFTVTHPLVFGFLSVHICLL